MAKIRVGQLAKELNLKVGDLLTRLHQMGVEAKSNLSTVDDEIAARVRSAGPLIAEPSSTNTKAPAKSVVPAGTRASFVAPSACSNVSRIRPGLACSSLPIAISSSMIA